MNEPPQSEGTARVLGLRPIGSTPAEFKRYVESEIKHYAEIVRLAGIQPNSAEFDSAGAANTTRLMRCFHIW
jgi:hypothetical protein